MELKQQKELVEFIERYNSISSATIKKNIIYYIDNSVYRRNSKDLADKVNMSIQAIYSYKQPQKPSKIGFEVTLKLADALEIGIEKLMQEREGNSGKEDLHSSGMVGNDGALQESRQG